MKWSKNKDLCDLIDEAIAAGWRAEKRGSGHIQLKPPNGGMIVVASSTPSDFREVANTRARMRRAMRG